MCRKLYHLVALVAFIYLTQCRSLPSAGEPAAGPGAGDPHAALGSRVIDAVPAHGLVGVLWIQDLPATLEGLSGFLHRFEEPGDATQPGVLARLYSAAAHVLQDPNLVDARAGLALFATADGAAPILAVRAVDPNRLAGAIAEVDGRSAVVAEPQSVNGYRITASGAFYQAAVGNTVLIAGGTRGHAAMVAALRAMRPDQPAPATPWVAQPGLWELMRKAPPSSALLWWAGRNPMLFALDISSVGFELRTWMRLDKPCEPDAARPLADITRNFDANTFIAVASRARCDATFLPGVDHARASLEQFKNTTGVDLTKDIQQLLGTRSLELFFQGEDPNTWNAVFTAQVLDPARLKTMLDAAVKRSQPPLAVTRGEHHGESIDVYSVSFAGLPALAALGIEMADVKLQWALAKDTLRVTLGHGTWREQTSHLAPKDAASPTALPPTLSEAQDHVSGVGFARLERVAEALRDRHLPTLNLAALQGRLVRTLQRLGTWEWTGAHDDTYYTLHMTCRLSDRVDPIPEPPAPPPSNEPAFKMPRPRFVPYQKPMAWVVFRKNNELSYLSERIREHPCSQAGKLHMSAKATSVVMQFSNLTGAPLQLVELDAQGKHGKPTTMPPAYNWNPHSFAGRTWMVLGKNGRCRTLLVPEELAGP